MTMPSRALSLLLLFAPFAAATAEGTLHFVADGEERAREGFTSGDGWTLHLDHLFITVDGITAYITDPPYDTASGWELNERQAVALPGSHTLDLARADADPFGVGSVDGVAAGHYNALDFRLAPATDGPATGHAVAFIGQATRGERSVAFTLTADRTVHYRCGEFVGDVRKGIVATGETGAVEMTFHLDHVFGRDDRPADAPMNEAALRFDSIAALAADGKAVVDLATLGAADPQARQRLEDVLLHFAHVGEGHCLARFD